MAKQLYFQKYEEFSSVVVKKQINGRGRLTKKWHSPVGNLYFSTLLKPKYHIKYWSQISFVVALAVKSVINNNINCNIKFKWPNDIMIDFKKVSGVLLEPTDDKKAIIIGIGINLISNPEIKGSFWKGTNLYDVSGFKLIPENLSLELLEQIIKFVHIWYEQGFKYIKSLWLKNVLFLNQELYSTDLENRVIGEFLGIDDLGQMIIKDKVNNSLKISSGTFIPINQ